MHLLKVNQDPILMNGMREAEASDFLPTPLMEEEGESLRRQLGMGNLPSFLSRAYGCSPYSEPRKQTLAITEDESCCFYYELTTSPYLAPLDDFGGGGDDIIGCPFFESLECVAGRATTPEAPSPPAIAFPQQEGETDFEIAPYLHQQEDTANLTLPLFSDLA